MRRASRRARVTATRTGRRTSRGSCATCASAARSEGTRKNRSESIANQRSLGVAGSPRLPVRAARSRSRRRPRRRAPCRADGAARRRRDRCDAGRRPPTDASRRRWCRSSSGSRLRRPNRARRQEPVRSVRRRPSGMNTMPPPRRASNASWPARMASPAVSRELAHGPDADLLGQLFGQTTRARSGVAVGTPLCTMTRRNRPRAASVAASNATSVPPADSPNSVTLVASPPNARDLVAHPPQRRDQVENAPVAAHAFVVGEVGMREETERAEPVVDRDDDDIAARREDLTRDSMCAPDPWRKPPPWIHTITGRSLAPPGARSGAHTLSDRQSSDCGMSTAMNTSPGGCNDAGPNASRRALVARPRPGGRDAIGRRARTECPAPRPHRCAPM